MNGWKDQVFDYVFERDELTVDSFSACFNQLLELSVKNVTIPEEKRVRLQYKLTQFGLKNVNFKSKCLNGGDSWQASINRIQSWFRPILAIKDLDPLSTDDETLLRLKLIYGELWFLSSVAELRSVSLREMMFCLAAFLLTFQRDSLQFGMYRLLLYPENVRQLLAATISDLGFVRKNHPLEKQLRVCKRLRRTYRKVRQLYLMHELVTDMEAIRCDESWNSITVAAMDRVAFKICSVLEDVCDGPMNLRYNLALFVRNLQRSGQPAKDYVGFFREMPAIETLCSVVLSYQLNLAFSFFLRKARKCGDVKKLRCLCQYVYGFKHIASLQSELNQKSLEFYDQLRQNLIVKKNPDARQSLLAKQEANENDIVNQQLDEMCFIPSRVALMTNECADMGLLKRQIDADLVALRRGGVEKMSLWHSIELETVSLMLTGPTIEGEQLSLSVLPDFPVSEIVKKMWIVLSRYECLSVEGIVGNVQTLPRSASLAMAQWLTEYFHLKHEAPVFQCNSILIRIGGGLITGVNWLSYLTAGYENYYTMEDDCNLGCWILGLLLVEASMGSQQQQIPVISVELTDVRSEGLDWVKMQKNLLDSVLKLDLDATQRWTDQGAAVDGCFLAQIGEFDRQRFHPLGQLLTCHLYDTLNESKEVIASMIDFVYQPNKCSNSDRKLVALCLGKFEEAFYLEDNDFPNIDTKFYSWSSLVQFAVQRSEKFSNWVRKNFEMFFEKLIESRNVKALEDLLQLKPSFTLKNNDLIVKIIKAGTNEMPELLKTTLERVQEDKVIKLFIEAAIRSHNFPVLKFLIDHSSHHDYLLQLAIQQNQYKVVRFLIPLLPHDKLHFALFTASSQNRWRIAQFLLQYDADPYKPYEESSAFRLAVAYGNIKFVQQCSPDAQRVRSVFQLAVKAGHFGMVRYLFNTGFCQSDNREILLDALQSGSLAIQKLILAEFPLAKPPNSPVEIANWINLIEQWKHLELFEQLVCDVIPWVKTLDRQIVGQILQRVQFYRTLNGDLWIQNTELEEYNQSSGNFTRTDRFSAASEALNRWHSCNKEFAKSFQVRVFNSGLTQFANVKVIVLDAKADPLQGSSIEHLIIKELSIQAIRKAIRKIPYLDLETAEYCCSISLFSDTQEYQKCMLLHTSLIKITLTAGNGDSCLIQKLLKSTEVSEHQKIKMAAVLLESETSYNPTKEESQLNVIRNIIELGSIEAFKLFLKMHEYKEDQEFELTSKALEELNSKHVRISEKLQIYLQYRVARYGFRYLTIFEETKDVTTSIQQIREWIEQLTKLENSSNYLAIDNEVLFRLRMIHKRMYLIQYDKTLQNMPLQETVFLIAIFLSTFKTLPKGAKKLDVNYDVFRLMINKRSLMKYLKLVAALLDDFQNKQHHAKIKQRKRRKVKFLINLHSRLREIYSLSKIYNILNSYSLPDKFTPATVASFKRFVQILGEAFKSTKSTPNLPLELNRSVEQMLMRFVTFHKQNRDMSCHDFPLGKTIFTIDQEVKYYQSNLRDYQRYLRLVQVAVSILLVRAYSECFRSFFKSARGCHTLADLQDLLRFTGNQTVASDLIKYCLADISKYREDIANELGSVECDKLSAEAQISIERLKAKNQRRERVISALSKISSFRHSYQEILTAGFASPTVDLLHRMLDVNILSSMESNILLTIYEHWLILEEDLVRLANQKIMLTEHSLFMVASLQVTLELKQDSEHQSQLQQEVVKITEHFFGDLEPTDEGTKKLKTRFLNILQNKMKTNIFDVKTIIENLARVAKIHNSKKRNFDKLRNEYREKNQNIFCAIQRKIGKLLKLHDCATVEKLILNAADVPMEAVLAMEFWMLELSEILIATKQFQDDPGMLLNEFQFICGKNFRNYLAHDGLSYDLLTNSSRIKVLINALVMSETKWNLYGKTSTRPVPSLLPTIDWIETQENLKLAVQNSDHDSVERALSNGALVSGRFWTTTGLYDQLRCVDLSEVLSLSSTPEALKNCVGLQKLEWKSERTKQFLKALNCGDFENVLRHADCVLWRQVFRLLPSNYQFFPLLGALAKHFDDKKDFGGLWDISVAHFNDLFEVLLCTASNECIGSLMDLFPDCTLAYARLSAITLFRRDLGNWQDLFPVEVIKYYHLLLAAVVNNQQAFKYFASAFNFNDSNELQDLILQCAKYGRTGLMQILVNTIKIPKNYLNYALRVACEHQRWKTAKYLLQVEANPCWSQAENVTTAAAYIIQQNCFKNCFNIKQTISSDPESLRLVAACGTLQMLEYCFNRGVNVWRQPAVLSAAMCSRTVKDICDCIYDKLFNLAAPENLNEPLQRWWRILNERKIIEFFKIDFPNLFQYIIVTGVEIKEKINYLEKYLQKMERFGTINEECFAKEILFYGIPLEGEAFVEHSCELQHLIEEQTEIDCFENFVLLLNDADEQTVATLRGKLTTFAPNVRLVNHLNINRENITPTSICSALQQLDTAFSYDFSLFRDSEDSIKNYHFLRIDSLCCLVEHSSSSFGSPIKSLLNTANPQNGQTILHHLSAFGKPAFLELLLANGANPMVRDSLGRTALHHMLQAETKWEVHECLLKHCKEQNIRDPQGVHIFNVLDDRRNTPLSVAVELNNLNAVQYLLENGADQTIPASPGMSLLKVAVYGRRMPMIDLLLNDINNRPIKTDYLRDALILAVKINDGNSVRRLLDAGADPGFKDKSGYTHVCWSIKEASYEALRAILQHTKKSGRDVVSKVTPDESHALVYCLRTDNKMAYDVVMEHLKTLGDINKTPGDKNIKEHEEQILNKILCDHMISQRC